MATAAPGPRDYITPEAFRVADHLIGVPLAKPWRRLGAMLIDLLLVGILSLMDAPAFLIAVVGAFFVFRFSRGGEGRWYRRFYRHGLGCFGALLTFVGLFFIGDSIADLFRGEDDDDAVPTVTTDSAGNVAVEDIGLVETGVITAYGVRVNRADDPAQRAALADELVETALDAGFSHQQIRTTVRDLGDDEVLHEVAVAAIEAANERRLARSENRTPRSTAEIARDDSLTAVRLAEAQADSSAALLAAAGGDTALAATRDTVRELSTRVGQLEEELETEQAQRTAAEQRLDDGAVRWVLSSVSDELGLGLGWLGLYFTAFLVLGGGQTPGKKLFRLRVIRLDGRPLGWWTSLQRFGGYSASVFTGLLGFAEMFWDENRQALQDKLVHTVVIQEPKKGAPPPVEVPFAGDEPVVLAADESDDDRALAPGSIGELPTGPTDPAEAEAAARTPDPVDAAPAADHDRSPTTSPPHPPE